MSASLGLRLSQSLGDQTTSNGAVANLYAYDDAGKRDPARDRRNVVIPAGQQVDPLKLNIDPGRYLIEVMLPSGETATEQVDVKADAHVAVDLAPPQTPPDWLSWHHYLGNLPSKPAMGRIPGAPSTTGIGGPRLRFPTGVPADTALKRPADGGSLGPGMEESSAWLLAAGLEEALAGPVVSWIGDPVDAMAGDPQSAADAWEFLGRDEVRRDPVSAVSRSTPLVVKETASDVDRQVALLGCEGPLAPGAADRGPAGPRLRRYVVSRSPTGYAELACVPVPWQTAEGGLAPVELLVRVNPLAGESTLAMSPRDPEVGAALGYMASGSLANARILVDQAVDLLYSKMLNPLAAAAGGYVLIATEQRDEDQTWHGWVPNLASWFEWLPDGAIQHARLLLRHRRGPEDVDQAREALFTAYDRGLPFYSLGLQWLVDGLSMFASQDPEARARLARVQSVAFRANLQQPFTTIRLSER